MSARILEALRLAYRSRPVRTAAQTLVAWLSYAVTMGRGFESIRWDAALSVSALAGLYTLMQCIADGSSLMADPKPLTPPPNADGADPTPGGPDDEGVEE